MVCDHAGAVRFCIIHEVLFLLLGVNRADQFQYMSFYLIIGVPCPMRQPYVCYFSVVLGVTRRNQECDTSLLGLGVTRRNQECDTSL